MASPTDRLSLVFSALADPTRRAILARLAGGPAAVTELAAPFEMSLPAVSKHLKVLERAGLITRGREAQWRPCRLEAAPFREVASWLDEYRQIWDERIDRLDAYLATLTAASTPTLPPDPTQQPVSPAPQPPSTAPQPPSTSHQEQQSDDDPAERHE